MKVLSTILIVLLACGLGVAQCPADKAAAEKGSKGVSPFGVFHEVMAPTWHEAYPSKNFEAMFKAGPEFAKRFQAVAEMKHEFKHESRKAEFEKGRAEFGDLVTIYASAAERQDSTKVYETLPKLHSAFEASAQSLLPIEYPAMDGIMVTIGVIAEKHLPAGNLEGVTASTETLVTKVVALDETSIPADCKADSAAIMKDITSIKELAGKLKAACDKKDMPSYKEYLSNMEMKIRSINTTYLEA